MEISAEGIESIEIYANMVRVKHKNRGYTDSDKMTDILLGKICQQLEMLIMMKQAEKLL